VYLGDVSLLQRVLAIVVLAGCGFLAVLLAMRFAHGPPAPAATAVAAAAAAPAGATATPAVSATGSPGSSGGSDQGAEPATRPIPTTLPDVRVPDLTGKPRSLRDFLGRPLIVNFWATWCQPCRREMPLLQQLQQQYRAEGLQVLGVAVDSRAAVEQYLHTRPVDYPILAGETEATEAMDRFGAVPALPFSIFADAQGRIVVVKLGELHREDADYILAAERDLAAGHQSLAQTRTAIEAKLRELAIARAKTDGGGGGGEPR
jgi:thiol-disulfide isomerase/thioredoxin